jgi:hypothetical protein
VVISPDKLGDAGSAPLLAPFVRLKGGLSLNPKAGCQNTGNCLIKVL